MRKQPYLLVILASVLSNSSVIAGVMGEAVPHFNYVAALSIGPVWQSEVDAQTFFLAPGIEKTYTENNSTNTLADFEVFLGLQRSLTATFLGQLGVAVAATTNANFSGDIWDDASPEFDNYTYNYKIQHTHIALKGKLLANWGFIVMPWVSSSVGVGFNDAHSFSNTPKIFEALPNPDFTSHTQTTFTYTVSAGIQKVLNQNWQVGLGYEFADWGKSKLGRASGQTMGNGLEQNHLYTNGVLFNLTYLV
ncbi:porin family protein [Legionella sp. PC1000]|uniref:outer membrane protein n=1 Tax=Legionella sp. PC1000 TaxID=2746060 RepID=UPI0015FD47F4|nr:porin family protein [Legionella sp. PC1000]QLZ69747.1 porin family protein [Legionella sp. PC1000]